MYKDCVQGIDVKLLIFPYILPNLDFDFVTNVDVHIKPKIYVL